MVVNLCLPHFDTTAHCNKLCADGYDVTNLVSADPAVRRRGFKLEYFLRPPVQLTLKFGFQVELCRVDVELWPWGMDKGQACKRLEISTSSDPLTSTEDKQVQLKDQAETQSKVLNEQRRAKHQPRDGKSQPSGGHHWSLQAQQWGEESGNEPQQRRHRPVTESSGSEPEFKLVARCELRDETQVCFTRSNIPPRAPFLSPPPPQPANCRQEELWSRGLLSLGAVTQLRVTLPFGGAASSLGLKALTVWGRPARCCPAEEVERIKRVHEASEKRLMKPAFFAPSKRKPMQLKAPASVSIPEEFLDPLTQEVMMLPMLLPGGVSVDSVTLEEYQKREATWGRPPNDPFTGVPFTSSCQPLPNPQLKSRIDHFLLQNGMIRRDGMLGRQEQDDHPQASRLVSSGVHKQSVNSTAVPSVAQSNNADKDVQIKDSASGRLSDSTDNETELDRRKKRKNTDTFNTPAEVLTAENHLQPQMKRSKKDSLSAPSYSSHEQRLSASLDEALFSALQGRPSFTSNLPQQQQITPHSKPLTSTQPHHSSSLPNASTGEESCSACSCSLSVYSASASPLYRLTCGHLLCRACLQKKSKPLLPSSPATSHHILCPTCRSSTTRCHITRVHH